MPRSLAEDLEVFVKEQAKLYGEVISYVPAAPPKGGATMASTEIAAVATPSIEIPGEISVTHQGFAELKDRLEPYQSETWVQSPDLTVLNDLIKDCQKCRLGETRTKFVFGVGDPKAKVMVIGEAPGADEDQQGEPFVGRAGQLLNKMLEAINFKREEVFIVNILKSRPPNNRDPKPDEVEACEPYLWKQILLIQPKVILCVGRVAGTNLMKLSTPSLAKMRGNVYDFYGIKVMATFHPAALLRNPAWKRDAWEDLKKFRQVYDTVTS